MGKPNYKAEDLTRDKRKYRRYPLECAVDIRFSCEEVASELKGITRNVSIGGLLVCSPSWIAESCPVSFVLTVQASHLVHPVRLLGSGKVARVNPCARGYEIGVECNKLIEELETSCVTDGSRDSIAKA